MAIPSKKGLAAQFHWFKGSALVNINGGHSEGYIRNASLGSVPKIANLLTLYTLLSFWFIRTNIVLKGYFAFKAYRLVCFTLLIAFQILKARVAYGCSLSIGM